MALQPLPVDEVLPALVSGLRQAPHNAVLVAPPGAGKTTRVPQTLVDTLGVEGRVLVLEPRRLAARLAAQRIAKERGGRLGDEVGYQVRFEDRTGDRTRIAFLTEGILTRMLQDDPFLEGVGAVVLDEFHERSVHADLAIAFLREVQRTVRPELRIVVMSATLDPAPVARFLGDCPVVRSEGRSYPVEVRWLERADDRRVVDRVVSVARRALREQPSGDVLAFLPGAPEIKRAQDELTPLLDGVDICPLYGELDERAQDRAVGPPQAGRRKLILATNIAESSLTIPGVRVVVDGGEQKRMSHDVGLGVDRLQRVRISRRSVEQRAGRAGRLGPGVAYRCWTDKEEQSFAAEEQPELLRVDLSPVLLQILSWEAQDPLQFGWFQSPKPASVARALGLLRQLGALGQGFKLSARGRRLAQLPLHPRLGVLLLESASQGLIPDAARIAALVSERDILPPRERARLSGLDERSDLLFRLERLREWEARGPSSAGQLGLDRGAAQTVVRVARRLESQARGFKGRRGERPGDPEDALLQLVLRAYPDRVAMRLEQGKLRLLSGGAASLSEDSAVHSAPYLVAARIEAGPKGQAWVRMASEIDVAWLDTRTELAARFNPERLAVEPVRRRYYGDLLLDERPTSKRDPEAISAALEQAARADLDRALPLSDGLMDFFYRLRFLREALPDLELPDLGPQDRLRLLPRLCLGKRNFAQLQQEDLAAAFEAELGAQRAVFRAEAPRSLTVPSGSVRKLRYAPEGPPLLSVRLQEVFGLYDTPRIARGRVPVKMELLAPNQRPVQLTQDLRSFWDNTYAEVRKELRRRYPKHQWPEDPRDGVASAKVLRRRKKR